MIPGNLKGDILDHRQVSLPSLIPGAESPLTAYQLLFVTRNASFDLTTSVTTVIIPENPNPNRVLSYQIAYDSPDVNCSPSYGLQRGAGFAAAMWNQVQMSFVFPYLMSYKGLLGRRPILNIPDYEGSNAAFTVGPQSGYHTLDSIRAALNSKDITGIKRTARAIMFGYSGGALATEWASELHAEYAPKLNIAGAAMGGPPPNITNTYINVNGTQSPLNVWAMLGVMRAFPEVDEHMRNDIRPDKRSLFLGPQKRCTRCQLYSPKIPPNENVSSWFEHGDEFLYKFKEILDTNGTMGNHIEKGQSPNFPLYIFQGTKDNITAPIEDTDNLYHKYCDAGTNVTYVRYVGLDHGGTLLAGMYPAWTWITAVFNWVKIDECTKKDIGPSDGELNDVDVGPDMSEIEESEVIGSKPGFVDQIFIQGERFVPGSTNREDL
ncbi:hypothetical protein EYZ11_012906 [Aspergillus tanneri]|uniref:Triacylglycerol lipase n=1 Tax=Aspergillus tanneri TaxID=1220188 RepID=A0A4S3IZ14_9EURO|nr:uncharacterized protein ATNIH1004_006618 [Aspergillus tanneri]KAA8647916.1 hypothetical protein ATNIH1004_006618 [Aspergillus tanneri]THC87649.1 hypothetical protein EYZ11_012906 [Aspergillus tanneri]